MRDILFKAKRTDNGEWVEGYYVKNEGTKPGFASVIFTDIDTMFPECFDFYEIDESTLCQYTGLTDKNGQKIWENDIIQFEDRICHIYWLDKNAQFDCKFIKHNKDIVITNFKGVEPREYENYETIGNVFDNPELLKGGE